VLSDGPSSEVRDTSCAAGAGALRTITADSDPKREDYSRHSEESVEPRDWAEDATAERVARHVVRRAGPDDIVLMHHGGRRPSPAVAALQEVLEGLARTDLQPVTVSELLVRG
jgi:hypothetical protein